MLTQPVFFQNSSYIGYRMAAKVNCKLIFVDNHLWRVRVEENFFACDLFYQCSEFCSVIIKTFADQINLFWVNERFISLNIDDCIATKIQFLSNLITSVCSAHMR